MDRAKTITRKQQSIINTTRTPNQHRHEQAARATVQTRRKMTESTIAINLKKDTKHIHQVSEQTNSKRKHTRKAVRQKELVTEISEERRLGKECTYRRSQNYKKKKMKRQKDRRTIKKEQNKDIQITQPKNKDNN